MVSNSDKNKLKLLLSLVFFLCISVTINVLVYNFYYLRKVYKNVLTADGEWIISLDKFLGYFQDKIGMSLTLVNIMLIVAIVVIVVLEEIRDKRETISLLNAFKDKTSINKGGNK